MRPPCRKSLNSSSIRLLPLLPCCIPLALLQGNNLIWYQGHFNLIFLDLTWSKNLKNLKFWNWFHDFIGSYLTQPDLILIGANLWVTSDLTITWDQIRSNNAHCAITSDIQTAVTFTLLRTQLSTRTPPLAKDRKGRLLKSYWRFSLILAENLAWRLFKGFSNG